MPPNISLNPTHPWALAPLEPCGARVSLGVSRTSPESVPGDELRSATRIATPDLNRMASPVRVYFILAFALTWVIGGIGLLLGHWIPGWQPLSTSSPLYYLAGYSVSLTGIAMTARYAGRAGLRRLGQRLIPWRAAPHCYVIVVLGYAAITAVALKTSAFFHLTSIVVHTGPCSSTGCCWPL